MLASCVKSPGFSDIPEIEFLGLSASSMDQGSLNSDSLFLQFTFTDGDGDIGFEAEFPDQNIFVIDNRTGDSYDAFKAPVIPEQGSSKGIEGTVTVRLFTTCCLFPDGTPPCEAPPNFPTDTLTLDVYIKDRANNQSNQITTTPIVLFCN
jgi:hypothetical protein